MDNNLQVPGCDPVLPIGFEIRLDAAGRYLSLTNGWPLFRLTPQEVFEVTHPAPKRHERERVSADEQERKEMKQRKQRKRGSS